MYVKRVVMVMVMEMGVDDEVSCCGWTLISFAQLQVEEFRRVDGLVLKGSMGTSRAYIRRRQSAPELRTNSLSEELAPVC